MSARWLCILLVALITGVISCGDALAQARRDSGQLRLSEHAEPDQATFDGLQRRLDNLAPLKSSTNPWSAYHLAKAQAWLDFAFDARAQHDRSGAVGEALAEMSRLTALLEAKANDIALDTPIIPSSRKLRDDIWLKAEEMKRHPGFRCAAARIAQFEVQLVQAGQADKELGWRHSKPYLQTVERLVKDADARLAACHPVVTSAAQFPPEIAKQPPAVQVQSLAQNVHFAYRVAEISRPTALVLGQVAYVLWMNSALTLDLQGHADKRGSARYNLKLSRQRAEAVKEYLVNAGVAKARITITALGNTQPFAKGSTPSDYARNRRVQFVVSSAPEVTLTPQEGDLQIERDKVESSLVRRK